MYTFVQNDNFVYVVYLRLSTKMHAYTEIGMDLFSLGFVDYIADMPTP